MRSSEGDGDEGPGEVFREVLRHIFPEARRLQERDGWVEDMEEADIKKLEDAYAETRDELNNELVYHILKL